MKEFKIVQIEELPLEIADARDHVYYVRTKQNLQCLSKKDHFMKARYYKKITPSMPKLLSFGYLLVKNQFSLTLMI